MTDYGLRLEVSHTEGRCLVVLGGEIDIANADDVETFVTRALTDCPDNSAHVVLDLAGVTFLDSTGLAALLHLHHAGSLRGVDTTIERASPQVVKLIAVAGLTDVFKLP